MLSKKTKYGIKASAYLARRLENTPVQISEIANHESISIKFLERILLELKRAGVLDSKKGKGGGYFLARLPKDIPMTDIIRTLEGPIAMVPCVSLNFYKKCDDCKSEEVCAVNKLMIQVRDSSLQVFRNTSLQDLINY